MKCKAELRAENTQGLSDEEFAKLDKDDLYIDGKLAAFLSEHGNFHFGAEPPKGYTPSDTRKIIAWLQEWFTEIK